MGWSRIGKVETHKDLIQSQPLRNTNQPNRASLDNGGAHPFGGHSHFTSCVNWGFWVMHKLVACSFHMTGTYVQLLSNQQTHFIRVVNENCQTDICLTSQFNFTHTRKSYFHYTSKLKRINNWQGRIWHNNNWQGSSSLFLDWASKATIQKSSTRLPQVTS